MNPGRHVEFAASFTDPDSKITGYDWDFDGNGTIDQLDRRAPTTTFTYHAAGDFTAARSRSATSAAERARRPRPITVTPRRREPVVEAAAARAPRGKVTARVKCARRSCTLSKPRSSSRVGTSRTVRTLRRTLAHAPPSG